MDIITKVNDFVEHENYNTLSYCPLHSPSLLHEMKSYYDCECFITFSDSGMRHRVKVKSILPIKPEWVEYRVIQHNDGFIISEPLLPGVPLKLLYYDDNLWLKVFGSLVNYFNTLLTFKAKQQFCFAPNRIRNEILSTLVFHYYNDTTFCLYRCTVIQEKSQKFQFSQVQSMFDLMLYLVVNKKKDINKKLITSCGINCKIKNKVLRSNANIVSDILHKVYCVEGVGVNKLYNMISALPLNEDNENCILIRNLSSL